MRYICPERNKCGKKDPNICRHCIPHDHEFACNDGQCTSRNKRIDCVVCIPEFIEKKEMEI